MHLDAYNFRALWVIEVKLRPPEVPFNYIKLNTYMAQCKETN
jgi:hypothetical protein